MSREAHSFFCLFIYSFQSTLGNLTEYDHIFRCLIDFMSVGNTDFSPPIEAGEASLILLKTHVPDWLEKAAEQGYKFFMKTRSTSSATSLQASVHLIM